MRLKPIENPRKLLAKIAYWMSKRKFGKVLMPLKVVYARNPGLMWAYLSSNWVFSDSVNPRLSVEAASVYLHSQPPFPNIRIC